MLLGSSRSAIIFLCWKLMTDRNNGTVVDSRNGQIPQKRSYFIEILLPDSIVISHIMHNTCLCYMYSSPPSPSARLLCLCVRPSSLLEQQVYTNMTKVWRQLVQQEQVQLHRSRSITVALVHCSTHVNVLSQFLSNDLCSGIAIGDKLVIRISLIRASICQRWPPEKAHATQ